MRIVPARFVAGKNRRIAAVKDSRLRFEAVQETQRTLFSREDQGVRQTKRGKRQRRLTFEGQHQRRVVAERVKRLTELRQRLLSAFCGGQVKQQRHVVCRAKDFDVSLEYRAPYGFRRLEVRQEIVEPYAFFFQVLKSFYHFDSFPCRVAAHARLSDFHRNPCGARKQGHV